MRCVNSRVCFNEATKEIRDPYFEDINHKLAFMWVCDKCCAEYLALDPSLGFFERDGRTNEDMPDTQIKTADITLRFSHRAAAIHTTNRDAGNVSAMILFTDFTGDYNPSSDDFKYHTTNDEMRSFVDWYGERMNRVMV